MGANAQTAVPAFTAGQVLTAAQQTQINTGIPVFATTTTRDAAFGGTGEKTLAEGQFAYIEADNTTQYYDGAAWQTVGGGLTLVKTQTIGTAVSSVTVSDVFSATYDAYKIIISGGAGSTTLQLALTLGSTTTGYYWGILYNNYAASPGASGATNTTAITLAGGATSTTIQMNADIMNPFTAEQTQFFNNFWFDGTNIGNTRGYLDNTTSYTAFTLTTNTGTLTGGTIRVYGYQNS